MTNVSSISSSKFLVDSIDIIVDDEFIIGKDCSILLSEDTKISIDFDSAKKMLSNSYSWYNSCSYSNKENKLYQERFDKPFTFLKSLYEDGNEIILSRFLSLIKKESLDKFINHFEDRYLFQYIKIIPSLKNQTKSRHTHPEAGDYINNLYYRINIKKYREVDKKVLEKIDYRYFSDLLTILVFMEWLRYLDDYAADYVNENNLVPPPNLFNCITSDVNLVTNIVQKANIKVTNTKVTSILVRNILNSSKFFYNDYFAELSQIKLRGEKETASCIYEKQSLIYGFDDKIYNDKENTGFYHTKRSNINLIIKKVTANSAERNMCLILRVISSNNIKGIWDLPVTTAEYIFELLNKGEDKLQKDFNEFIYFSLLYGCAEYGNDFASIKKSFFHCDRTFLSRCGLIKKKDKKYSLNNDAILVLFWNKLNEEHLNAEMEKLDNRNYKNYFKYFEDISRYAKSLNKKRAKAKERAITDFVTYFKGCIDAE
ncbi:MAG: hypothetical protein WCG23_11805 [bacterium]